MHSLLYTCTEGNTFSCDYLGGLEERVWYTSVLSDNDHITCRQSSCHRVVESGGGGWGRTEGEGTGATAIHSHMCLSLHAQDKTALFFSVHLCTKWRMSTSTTGSEPHTSGKAAVW